jgi:hypothetical protein
MTTEYYDNSSVLTSDEDTNKKSTIYSMYKIVPKNKESIYCYVGHTSNFLKRKDHHNISATNTTNSKHHQLVYQTIYKNGGWDSWEMIEIEKFECYSKLEARMREQQLIIEHNANINTLSAFITEDERKKKKQEITNKYQTENVELIKEQQKQYKQEHKDVIKEQMRKYRQENKEETYKKQQEYRKLHAEKYKENDKIWREANKEILKEKRKIYEAKKKAKLLEEEQQQLKELKN